MSSLCAYCDLALEAAPSRACPRCGDLLHASCLAQCEAHSVRGCGHEGALVGCAFVGEHALLSLDGDGALRLWDLRTGHDSLAAQLGPNATHLLASADGARLVALTDNALYRFSAEAPGAVESSPLRVSYHAAALSPDGARLVVMNNSFFTVDLATGMAAQFGTPLEKYVQRLVLSPDGLRVAVLYGETRLLVCDVETGEPLFDRDLAPQGSYFDKLSFSTSGDDLLVEGNNALHCFDAFTGSPRWREEHNKNVLGWRCNDDDTLTLLVTGAYNDVQLQTLDRRQQPALGAPRTFTGLCSSGQRHCFFSAQRVAVGYEGSLLVADAGSGQTLLLEGHRRRRWLSPEQHARALWHRDEFYGLDTAAVLDNTLVHPGSTREAYGLRFFSAGTGEALSELVMSAPPNSLRALRGPDGARYLVGVSGNLVMLYNADAPAQPLWSTEVKANTDLGTVMVTPGADGEALLLVSASWQGLVSAFELATGALRWSLAREGGVLPRANLVRLPDGTVLWLVPRSGGSSAAIECLELTPAGETKPAGSLECPYPMGVNMADVTPDGARLLVYSVSVPPRNHGAVGLWDLEKREFVRLVTAPFRDWQRGLAVSPSGTLFAVASNARLLHVCELLTGRLVATFGVLPRALDRLLFSTDGATLFGTSEDSVLYAWDVSGLCPRADAYAAGLLSSSTSASSGPSVA